VQKYITIYPKFHANNDAKSVSWVSVMFPKLTGRLSHDVGWNSRDIANQESSKTICTNREKKETFSVFGGWDGDLVETDFLPRQPPAIKLWRKKI